MRLTNLPENQVTLLLGAPRSGTTWLGKILDSHPDVLYRHEPDTVRQTRELPAVCLPEQIPDHQDMARAYLRGLMNVTALPSAGSLPVFPKSYRLRLVGKARAQLINSIHAADRWKKLRAKAQAFNVPDMISARQAANVHLVLKSIRSRGRAGLLAQALPQARIVFEVRDPMGYVAAMLRGTRHGRFSSRIPAQELLNTAQARKAGLTETAYHQLPVLEQLAWNWCILNQKAIDELAGLGRVKIVHYNDLCTTPVRAARDVFNFLDLPWHAQTDDFIRACLDYEGKDPAFRLYRNARRSLNRWQGDLRQEDRDRIEAVARKTPLWDLCMIPATA